MSSPQSQALSRWRSNGGVRRGEGRPQRGFVEGEPLRACVQGRHVRERGRRNGVVRPGSPLAMGRLSRVRHGLGL
jgi:hypothetical protein